MRDSLLLHRACRLTAHLCRDGVKPVKSRAHDEPVICCQLGCGGRQVLSTMAGQSEKVKRPATGLKYMQPSRRYLIVDEAAGSVDDEQLKEHHLLGSTRDPSDLHSSFRFTRCTEFCPSAAL